MRLDADMHRGTRDQLADVVVPALAAERALQRAAAGTAPSGTGRVVGLAESTASTIRYSFACSAVMKKSRSVSRWDLLHGLPGVVDQDAVQLLPHPQDLLGLDVNVGGLPLHSAWRLMDQGPGV